MAVNAMQVNETAAAKAPAEKAANASSLKITELRQQMSDSGRTEQKNEDLSVEEARAMADSLEGYMEILTTSLGFSVNENVDRVVVTITNKQTDEVIRQIPAEELIALREKMKELTGIIFNESV